RTSCPWRSCWAWPRSRRKTPIPRTVPRSWRASIGPRGLPEAEERCPRARRLFAPQTTAHRKGGAARPGVVCTPNDRSTHRDACRAPPHEPRAPPLPETPFSRSTRDEQRDSARRARAASNAERQRRAQRCTERPGPAPGLAIIASETDARDRTAAVVGIAVAELTLHVVLTDPNPDLGV